MLNITNLWSMLA